MHVFHGVLVLLAAVAIVEPGQAQIVNGSFEPAIPFGDYIALPGGSTAIPGWTTTGTGVEWFQPVPFGWGTARDELYCVDLANLSFKDGGIEQEFLTTPSEVYVITFSLGTFEGNGRDGVAEIVVSADATMQTFAAANHTGQIVWDDLTFTFTADDGSATLNFSCFQDGDFHFAFIDLVEATQSTPAESSSWGAVKTLYR